MMTTEGQCVNIVREHFLTIIRSEVVSFGGWRIILKSSCRIFRV